MSLPPSMFGDEGGDGGDYLDSVYNGNSELWDSLADNLEYGGGHELFDDVAEALEEKGYGQGDGFTIDEWMDAIQEIHEIYQDEEGHWHISFDWEIETDEGEYGGSRGW